LKVSFRSSPLTSHRSALLAGVPFTVIIIELPQKFQAVNDVSPLAAGVRLLPYSLPCAVASALTGGLTSGLRIPPIYVILTGTILQTIGLALSYALPISLHVPASQYGYEALAGFGVGLTLTTLLSVAPFVVQKSDRGMKDLGIYSYLLMCENAAVALSGVTQLRVLGGAIGVSAATNLLNNHIEGSLSSVLSPTQLKLITKSTRFVAFLDPAVQDKVKLIFAEGYNLGTATILAFTVAQFLSILLMWERKPRRLP